MPKRKPGVVMRVLIGTIGVAAIVASVLVGAHEVRIAEQSWPYWRALAAIALCALIVWSGLMLVRGAISGRIEVRRTRRPR